YTAMLTQIERAKGACGAREEEILQLMEDIERLGEGIREMKASIEKSRLGYEAKKKSLEDRLATALTEMANENKHRDSVRAAIDHEHLNQFETLAAKLHGIAVSAAVSGVCRGCMRDIPPQTYNLLFRRDRILSCPNCQRILYLEESTSH
ncbi:MAG: zinc ribbon domain-containing protein, partial [Vicinamibacteria bacterium]